MAYRIIVGGTPKSGTTSLHNMLRSHLSVTTSSIKQTNYFLSSNELNKLSAARIKCEAYAELFSRDYNFTLDTSPDYVYSEKALTDIADEFNRSGGVFIIICRDPVDRFVSHFNHLKQQGILRRRVTVRSYFQRCLKEESVSDYRYRLLLLGNYQYYVNRAKRILGEDNVLVFSFEQLKKNPIVLLSKVYSHAGMEAQIPSDVVTGFDTNKTVQPRSIIFVQIFRLLRKMALQNLNLKAVELLKMLFSNLYKKVNYKPLRNLELDVSFLKEYYEPELEYLDNLFIYEGE